MHSRWCLRWPFCGSWDFFGRRPPLIRTSFESCSLRWVPTFSHTEREAWKRSCCRLFHSLFTRLSPEFSCGYRPWATFERTHFSLILTRALK